MKRIRVLIIEDSAVIREFLCHIIASDPRLEVAAAVESAEEGLRILDRISPDVVSLDIRLPGMNGLEATRQIMSRRPTPIVVVSASVESEDLKITMSALQAGALTVVEKPVGTTQGHYESLAERVCTQLAIMSQIKVVRQSGRSAVFPKPPPPPKVLPRSGRYSALGVAASTGGPNAITSLLGALGSDFPLPIVVVQHMTPSFSAGFASWLSSVCPFPVEVVSNRQALVPGRAYLAAGDHHLRVTESCAWIDGGDPVCAQRPSATVLFESMARSLGPRALGVLLTGMGEDGAAGLLEVHRAGGYCIAEHASTAVVYGMPAAAERLGAAHEMLPLPAIAPRIIDLVLNGQGGR
jgi:two-component system chemotaxis response regulator CheB